MKLLRVKFKGEFYKFSKNESYETLFVELLEGITFKILVKCNEQILLIGFAHKIKVFLQVDVS